MDKVVLTTDIPNCHHCKAEIIKNKKKDSDIIANINANYNETCGQITLEKEKDNIIHLQYFKSDNYPADVCNLLKEDNPKFMTRSLLKLLSDVYNENFIYIYVWPISLRKSFDKNPNENLINKVYKPMGFVKYEDLDPVLQGIFEKIYKELNEETQVYLYGRIKNIINNIERILEDQEKSNKKHKR